MSPWVYAVPAAENLGPSCEGSRTLLHADWRCRRGVFPVDENGGLLHATTARQTWRPKPTQVYDVTWRPPLPRPLLFLGISSPVVHVDGPVFIASPSTAVLGTRSTQ